MSSKPSSSTEETIPYASLTSNQNGLDLIYQSRIDRQKLYQIKSNRQFVQTLFCGGPIADIAVCPHALPDGKDFYEKYLISQKFSRNYLNENILLATLPMIGCFNKISSSLLPNVAK